MPISPNAENVIVTSDPEHIQDWIEEHGGRPAMNDDRGTVDVPLDIIFEDEDEDENLKPIDWEEFFIILNEKDLAFAYDTDENKEILDSQRFDFIDRKEANTEMEESEVYSNTLETADDEDFSEKPEEW